MTARLTFTVSHFAEKARWALDHKGVEYVEERLVPGDMPIIRRIAPGTSVPVLRDGDRIIQGSSSIIDDADERSRADLTCPLARAAGTARRVAGTARAVRESESLG